MSKMKPRTVILAFTILVLARNAAAQFCPVPALPPLPSLSACPSGSSIVQVNSLPLNIGASDSGKTFCINFSPASSNTGGISISNTSNIVIEGAGHSINGAISIVDSSGVEIRNIISSQSVNIPGTTVTRDINIHNSKFGGLNAAATVMALKNLQVRDSRFVCNCNQAPTDTGGLDNYCVFIQSETYGQTITPLYFERNFIESDCTKDMKIMAKAPAGGLTPVKHVIQGNYMHSLRVYPGNEVSNFTWRNSPGGTAALDRNIFANNTMISEGHADGIYLRDDMDNVDITSNCFEIKNSTSYGVFLGGIGTASGNLDTSFSSGVHIFNNKVAIRGGPALNFQAIEADPESANNPNLISRNVLYSSTDSAVTVGGGHADAVWDHNTFYSSSGAGQALIYDQTPINTQVKFTNNIFGCSRNVENEYRTECLKLAFDGSKYTGNNNLFFNFGLTASTPPKALSLQIYAPYDSYQIALSHWITDLHEDTNSRGLDPLFVNRLNLDLRLSSASPARGMASDGSDIGALQFSNDSLAPAAPLNLRVN